MKAETDLAFPSSKVVFGKTFNHNGMDLRTYIAAKVLQAFIESKQYQSSAGSMYEVRKHTCAEAVNFADALIEELAA